VSLWRRVIGARGRDRRWSCPSVRRETSWRLVSFMRGAVPTREGCVAEHRYRVLYARGGTTEFAFREQKETYRAGPSDLEATTTHTTTRPTTAST